MIINHDKRFVFVHVPRTGGHSAYRMLGGQTSGAMHPRRKAISYPDSYFSFGFLRNPWARMYSFYRRQRVMPKYHGVGFKKYLELIERSDISQCGMWFVDGCDFVGKYERLQSDWDFVLDKIGWKPQILPHLNKYTDDDYRLHYDNEMIEKIALHHKRDIDWGGYTF